MLTPNDTHHQTCGQLLYVLVKQKKTNKLSTQLPYVITHKKGIMVIIQRGRDKQLTRNFSFFKVGIYDV